MAITVGRALKGAAVVAGLTQQEVAERVGFTIMTVSHHMNGRTIPNVDQLQAYADVLNAQFLIAPAAGIEPATYRLPSGFAA
jgi:transcriptional regulator with XRE-family HTH domain